MQVRTGMNEHAACSRSKWNTIEKVLIGIRWMTRTSAFSRHVFPKLSTCEKFRLSSPHRVPEFSIP